MSPAQGDIWWAEAQDKRRPVLVVTRDAAIGRVHRIMVAPVTRTVRHIPTEVPLGPDHGLPVECAATFDNLETVLRSYLTEYVGHLRPDQGGEICRALSALADC
ncbi:MAG TPA: type II toxin-antitoxin system PemK/MazF family toxin [Iamia sp.]|nr:type II toxin-antitoxin system PemK/MazF family toxin [Iamia sp.]